jgi:hypothetical protein
MQMYDTQSPTGKLLLRYFALDKNGQNVAKEIMCYIESYLINNKTKNSADSGYWQV